MKKNYKIEFNIIDSFQKTLQSIFENINLSKYNTETIMSEIYILDNGNQKNTWDIYGENEFKELILLNEDQHILEAMYILKDESSYIYFYIYDSYYCRIISNSNHIYNQLLFNIKSNNNFYDINATFSEENIEKSIAYFDNLSNN